MKSASKIGSSTSFRAGLHDPVAPGRNPQSPQLARGLRDHPLAHGQRGEPARLEVVSQLAQELLAVLAPIERGFTPSTPAVRAPRLPRTRSQPTVRKAGSQTRLNRSSNRRSGSSVAHRCSLVWISSTRAASSRLGHGASVFTGDLLAFQQPPCEPAGSLRHVPGFPGSDYYGPSVPSRRYQPTASLPATTRRRREGNAGTVPTFTTSRSTGSAPSSSPCSIATSTPQTFLVASPPAAFSRLRSSRPRPLGRCALLPGHPPGWSRCHA